MLTKQERRDRKSYRRLVKKWSRKIRKKAKYWSKRPWDAEGGLSMFIEYMRFMKEYYNQSWNVWGEECADHDRYSGIAKALQGYEDWYNGELGLQKQLQGRAAFFDTVKNEIDYWWD